MLSGSPTQNATSVADLATLQGLNDTPYKDGEFAYVVADDTYYRVNRNAASGIPTKSGNGRWTIYSPGAATTFGSGPPSAPVVIGGVYVNTTTGTIYAGSSAGGGTWVPAGGAMSGAGGPPVLVTVGGIYINTTTGATYVGTTIAGGTWVSISGGAPVPVRPAPPAGTTHNYNFDQLSAPTPATVLDTVGTSNLNLAAFGGVFGVDFLVQEPRPFPDAKGTRLVVANGLFTQPPQNQLTKAGTATLAPTDNPNAGYTIGWVGLLDLLGFATPNDQILFAATTTVAPNDSLRVTIAKGVLTLKVFLATVAYSSGLFRGAGAEQGTFSIAITFTPNALGPSGGTPAPGGSTATFLNGNTSVVFVGPNPGLVDGDFVRATADGVDLYAQIADMSGFPNVTLVSGYSGASSVGSVAYTYIHGPANARLYIDGQLAVSVPVADGVMEAFDTVAVGAPGWSGNLFTAPHVLTTAELLAYTTAYLGF
ncbi:MAG: hypothetical protein ACHREM_02260 [Polyangiales bacterium]